MYPTPNTDEFRDAFLSKAAFIRGLASPAATKRFNPVGGAIAGLTGLGNAIYDYNDSDGFGEDMKQVGGDLFQGGLMYGLSQNPKGIANTAGTLNKFAPNSPLLPQAPMPAGAKPTLPAAAPDWRLGAGKMPRPPAPSGVLNTAAKGGAKKMLGGAVKYLGKKIIPGAALGFAIPSAISRWKEGDRLGAAGEMLSGGLSAVPGVGWALGSTVDAGMSVRDKYKEQHPEGNFKMPSSWDESVKELQKNKKLQQPAPQLGSNSMRPAPLPAPAAQQQVKTALSQFRQDIENPEAGLDSDLYSAVAPMVSSTNTEELPGSDRSRINQLKEQMRKGIVGLEYLTGLKRNKGETFYDEHPVQAVATDVLGKSPLLGAGVAAGGIGLNYLRQKDNMDMAQPASMARAKNPQDPKNPANLLDPEKGTLRADIARVFGDEANPEARLTILDRLNKEDPTKGLTARYRTLRDIKQNMSDVHGGELQALHNQLQSYQGVPGSEGEIKRIQAEINAIEKTHGHNISSVEGEIKKLLAESKTTRGASALPAYADLLETLQTAKQKGGLKPYLGENLRGKFGKGAIGKAIDKHILPGKDQAIGDVLESLKLTGANPHFDEMLIKDTLTELNGGNPPSEEFLNTTLKRIANKKHQASGLGKAFNRVKFPLAAGAGIAAGGAGLYGLIKAIQNQIYSGKKTDEWKRTLLKSRGDFDAANRI